MTKIMRTIAELTEKHRTENWHIVTPLFNHYILPFSAAIGSDYAYWKNYSRDLLTKCDLLIVVEFPEVDVLQSTGVQDEIEFAQSKGIKILYLAGT